MTDEYDLELAYLRSHELHMKYIYGVRYAALALAAITIAIGAVMLFYGLQGSFNWAVEAPHTIGAKLTNASPGIVFATVGLIIAAFVIVQRPVSYTIGGSEGDDEPRYTIKAEREFPTLFRQRIRKRRPHSVT